MRKKLSAAAGLVTIAAAGALITSTPAFAAGDDIASITGVSAVASPASATAGQQATLSSGERTLANEGGRRHRHRRHHRHHRRHHRHHRHHRY